MNTEHTPGPWIVKGRKMEARIYGNVEGGPVAVVPYVTEWASNPYDAANATLIGAAPDLLSELDKACNVIAHCISEMPEAYREAMRTQLKSGRAAIIKAVAIPA